MYCFAVKINITGSSSPSFLWNSHIAFVSCCFISYLTVSCLLIGDCSLGFPFCSPFIAWLTYDTYWENYFLQKTGLGGGPIIGREYLSLLERNRPSLQWEKISAEHFFLYYDDQHVKHVVFYPSLMSIAMRLEEAQSWGAGISIWEIGQGLDYFFDIL